jgi:hypothetical protein
MNIDIIYYILCCLYYTKIYVYLLINMIYIFKNVFIHLKNSKKKENNYEIKTTQEYRMFILNI